MAAATVTLAGLSLAAGHHSLTNFQGRKVEARGTVMVTVCFDTIRTRLSGVCVLPRLTDGLDLILGMDFLSSGDLCIHTATGHMTLQGRRIANVGKPTIAVPEGVPTFLKDFGSVFAEPTELPPVRPGLDADIQLLPGAKLKEIKPIPMTSDKQLLCKQELDRLRAAGFIERSSAPFAAPAFFVQDKASSSRGPSKMRMVIDYRELNNASLSVPPSLPRIQDLLKACGPVPALFSKIDLRWGFNNLRLTAQASKLSAFTTDSLGTWQYKVMPFGIENGPAFMQTFMRSVLGRLEHDCAPIYLDDILVYSPTQDQHEKDLIRVFQALQEKDCHVRFEKCELMRETVNFVGFELSKGTTTKRIQHRGNNQLPYPYL
jgi:hypothetical protein